MSIHALVVDDSSVERMYLSTLLERLGIEVTEAENSDKCRIKAAEQKYDIMFIDYFMPDADGVHALKEIRNSGGSLNINTPAIALGTADPMLNDNFFILQGFDNYIEKPVNYEMLHASLLLYLRGEKRDEFAEDDKASPYEQTDDNVLTLPEQLYSIDGLNIDEGLRNCGSEDGYLSALAIFCNSAGKNADEIQGYYNTEDWENYTIKVHALKSSARIIGLIELSECAKQLEEAGNSGDIDFIRENTDKLLILYRSFTEKLKWLSESDGTEDDDDKPLADQDFLEDAFTSLEEFGGQMDYDMVETVITSVEEYRLPPDIKNIFDEVNEAFMNLDWNGIKVAAHRYVEMIYGDNNNKE